MRARTTFLALCLVLVGCGSGSTATVRPLKGTRVARWTPYVHVHRPLDVAGGRADGALVLAAAGRLYLLRGRAISRFAPAYTSPGGEEPYIAAPPVRHRGCSFGRSTVYAIRLHGVRGVTRITASGRVSRFARITAPGLIDGIAFDQTGAFGYRLLATINHGSTTTVDAVSCTGAVTTITRRAPRVEGGIAVAPRSFGRFAGDLIAPDETGGRIFAITPKGASRLVADSGLPHGGDIGVESEEFAPADRHARFLLADRLTPGNRHPGDDVLLTASFTSLAAAGVTPGDLLVATEGGAYTDAIRCGRSACTVRYVALGPPETHGEGHIAYVR